MSASPNRVRRRTSSKQKEEILNLSREGSDGDSDFPRELDGPSDHDRATSPVAKPKDPVTLNKIMTRSLMGILMIATFYGILQAGHLYCILFVIVIQCEIYREVINVRFVAAQEKRMPWFRTIQFAWFLVPMFYVYGDALHSFCSGHKQLKYITVVTQHTQHISYALYSVLFICSVLTLKQGLVKFQLSQYMWSIVTVCLVVFQCKYMAASILNGIFWFLFPIACVVVNDISAYFCGITMGKKFISQPLIAMSPNKTWEGFIGAAFCTMAFAFVFPIYLASSSWYVCPAEEITLRPFPPVLSCDPHPVFLTTVMNLPFFGPTTMMPMQLHGLWYGLFASVVAPFGGFLASAIKRAYKLKDFDSFFPGHGGVMDRADCQLVMFGFSSLYYNSFIRQHVPSVDKMVYLASMMTVANQRLAVQEILKQIEEMSA